MKRRVRISAVVVALVMTSALRGQENAGPAWPKEPTDFRGVAFGLSQKEARALLKELSCFSKDACTASLNLGGEVHVTNYFLFEHDKLVWVGWDFPSEKWEFIRDVLVQRYGEPMTRKQEPIQTRAGVEHLNEELGWIGERVVITADRYSGKVTEGGVFIAEKAWYEKKNADTEEAKKKAATSF